MVGSLVKSVARAILSSCSVADPSQTAGTFLLALASKRRESLVQTCKDCAAMKTPVPKRRAPLTPITSDDRYRFLGPLVKTDAGNR